MPRDNWKRARDKEIGRREAARNEYAGRRRKPGKRRKQIPANSPLRSHSGPKYRLKEGATVSICRRDDSRRQWQRHTMRRTLEFHQEYRSETCYGSSGAVILQYGDYLILTRKDATKLR